MDAVSYSLASKQAQRIEKFIENPDSTSGIVTVPKTIASGETITIPAGRVAVLPNLVVDGTLNIEGEIFIPSGATFSKVVETEGNQTISGIKTFSTSPIVPTPTNATDAANKAYVDTKANLASPAFTGSVTIGSDGTYVAGSIFSNASWGMIFRAKQASPSQAIFRWADAADTELFRWNGSALTCSITGNAATATKLTNSSGDWVASGAIDNVVGMLSWKNFGNGHVIFDASAGRAPNGAAINNTNSETAWSGAYAYPTLMGWNGYSTYGVRVDTARLAETATALSGVVGSAPSYACRAWVNFNGTGTVAIRASGNVSSITDNGRGDYTINFTTTMTDANYSSPSSTTYDGSAWHNLFLHSKTTSALRVCSTVFGGGTTDEDIIDIAIFR